MKIFHNDTEILDVQVDDSSYRYRAVKGEHALTLHFSMPGHVEIPVGAWTEFEGERYELEQSGNFKKNSTRNFEYTLVMEAAQAKLKKYKFRNTVDKRLEFSLTARPHEHLQMLVDNLNLREQGWQAGECVEAVEKLIAYNHAFCIDALGQMADEFNTEYEIVGKTIHLRKTEYNKDNPLPLSYGKGNGFRPGVGRSNFSDSKPVEVLFVQGGEENINPAEYGNKSLLLPRNATLKYDGAHFEDEQGFNAALARSYMTDADGVSLRRADRELRTKAEDSLDCAHISPKRVGTVTAVEVVDAAKNFYDIVDSTIPVSLNFRDYRVDGEKATIIFQSGMLAGREFDIQQTEKVLTGYDHARRKFEIVPQEMDGVTMPGGDFIPKVGDTYAVFHIAMPDAYICNNATKSGASWEMLREAVKYLYDNECPKFSFTGELDGIWAKKDWLNIGGRIRLGGYVLFSDTQFQPEGVAIRIVGIKDYINNPHSPEIELSNETVGSSFISELRKVDETEVVMEDNYHKAVQFTKRRFRDSQETIEMLGDALLENFTNNINPLSVETMAALVGDESLQFRFVDGRTDPAEVAHRVTYDDAARVLVLPGGLLQHMTLGIDTVSSGHAAGEYRFWDIPPFTTPALDDDKRYYLYAKVNRTGTTGMFYISERAIALEETAEYYHLLMGVLNSAYDGKRSYVSLYGFTEILPGQIVTNRIATADGGSFLDLAGNAMRIGDKVSYLDWNSETHNALSLSNATIRMENQAGRTMIFFNGLDGSGQLAGGNLTFDTQGNVRLQGDITATSGKIGQFEITDGDYGVLVSSGKACYTQAFCKLSYERIELASDYKLPNSSPARQVLFMAAGGAHAGGAGYCGGDPINARIDIDQDYYELGNTMLLKRKIGLAISVAGRYSTATDPYGDMTPNGNHAIFVEKGGFVGFRPFSRVVTASGTLLDTDSVVIANNTSGNITLTLPAAPQPDQRYTIRKLKASGKLYVNAPNGAKIIYWQNTDTPVATFEQSSRRTIELQYIADLRAWVGWMSDVT